MNRLPLKCSWWWFSFIRRHFWTINTPTYNAHLPNIHTLSFTNVPLTHSVILLTYSPNDLWALRFGCLVLDEVFVVVVVFEFDSTQRMKTREALERTRDTIGKGGGWFLSRLVGGGATMEKRRTFDLDYLAHFHLTQDIYETECSVFVGICFYGISVWISVGLVGRRRCPKHIYAIHENFSTQICVRCLS